MREYATAKHFQDLFVENASGLHLLSFLLTADAEKAEECFVSGFNDCAGGNEVFLNWAYTWARRVIVQNAIRMIAPAPDASDATPESIRKGDESGQLRVSELECRFANVLSLSNFERFVFVLSVLEQYSELDCSRLLKTSPAEIRKVRQQAILHAVEYGAAAAGH